MSLSVVLNVWWAPLDVTNKSIIEAVQHLVHGRLNPDSAARTIDDAIFSAERGVVRNEDHTYSIPVPQPTDNVAIEGEEEPEDFSIRSVFLFELLPRVALQIPADHLGQDRLVELLQSIRELPDRQIIMKWGTGTKRGSLWSREEIDSYQKHLTFMEPSSFAIAVEVVAADSNAHFAGLFGRIPKWKCPGGPYSNAPSTPRPSLQNFAAFCARLFAGGIYSLGAGCAILRASFATVDHSRPLPDDYDEHACAAAQWIIYAGPQLFEMCQRNAGPTRGRQSWDSWRIKITVIADAENLSEHCRKLGGRALSMMAQIERAGVTTNVVQKYAMNFVVDGTIVSTRPDARNCIGKRHLWDEYGQDELSDSDG